MGHNKALSITCKRNNKLSLWVLNTLPRLVTIRLLTVEIYFLSVSRDIALHT